MKLVLAFALAILAAGTFPAQTVIGTDITPRFVRESLRDKSVAILKANGKVDWEWTFSRDELIELDIVSIENQPELVIVVADIRTRSSPNSLKLYYTYSQTKPCRADPIETVTGKVRIEFDASGREMSLNKIESLSLRLTRSYI